MPDRENHRVEINRMDFLLQQPEISVYFHQNVNYEMVPVLSLIRRLLSASGVCWVGIFLSFCGARQWKKV